MQALLKEILEMLNNLDDSESMDKQVAEIGEYIKYMLEVIAKINWEYFISLQKQGFTEEQAMQIVLAGQKK